jgi:nucleoid DNA-binding protein
MNKDQLVSQLAQDSEVSKKVAKSVLASLVKAIQDSLKSDGNIRIDGLGTFVVSERKARTGVNPRTQEKINIPATSVPTFRASKVLKEAVKPPEKPKEKKASKKAK